MANLQNLVKGFATIDNLALVNVEGTGMAGVPGTASAIFSAVKDVGANVIMISQASSEHSVCFAVPETEVKAVAEALQSRFRQALDNGRLSQVAIIPNCSILAAVGQKTASTPGVSAHPRDIDYPRSRKIAVTASVVDKQKELLVNKVVREQTNSIDEMRRILKSLNHYEALGFNRHKKIDAAVLKKEYRKKAMLVHPDKNMGSSMSSESFKKLQCAYKVLADSVKKRDYDEQLRKEESMAKSVCQKSHSSSHQDNTEYRSEEPRRIQCTKCVKGFATIDNLALVNVEGTGMAGVPGTASAIFSAVKDVGANVIMISQASSEHSVCFAVPETEVKAVAEALQSRFRQALDNGRLSQVAIIPNYSILAAVGQKTASTPGVSAHPRDIDYPRSRKIAVTASVVDKQKELLVNKVVREQTNSIDEMRRILKSLNHYEALGFNRHKKIDAAVLKKEYRKKAMLVHPDKNMGSSMSSESFKKLQCAYKVLADSVKKRDYDEQLRKEESMAKSVCQKSHSSSHQDNTEYRSEEPRRIQCTKCVKGFATIDNLALVNVEGTGMAGVPGTSSAIFSAVKDVGANVIMISQASSEHSVCFAVPETEVKAVAEALQSRFRQALDNGRLSQVAIIPNCSILAAVGQKTASTPGVSAHPRDIDYPRSRKIAVTASVVDKQKELLVNKVVREQTNSIDEMRRILKSLNHYEALGFNRHKKIDAAVLKKEYRKKAMLVHPDKNMGSSMSSESFKKLQCAYKVLADSVKKRDYDEQLRKEESMAKSVCQKSHSSSHQDNTEYRSEEPRRIQCTKCG
ncbi:Bifunctional aspartokinase/homoserine dehydrogenase 1 [Lathyrus oleraceus]|uniref:aspartate kinase n=2 Tax=Pisum sativum TaxID=3888 RepID=A0A9D4X710_PEA|nr:Bifunctional aspartokinase/homoserine dehydrogenase 1 [Pisum sativum]